MSGFAPPPHNPDGRIFASYPMPAKIDLLNERPRRESLIEKELENKINNINMPKIQVSSDTQFETTASYQNQARPISQQSEQNQNVHQYEQRIITNMAPIIKDNSYSSFNTNRNQANQQQQQFSTRNNNQQQMVHQQQHLLQNQQPQVMQHNLNFNSPSPTNNQFKQVQRMTTTTVTTTNNSYQQQQQQQRANNAAQLASELAEKEAKLAAEINSLQQRPYSPYQVPNKIDLTSEQRSIQQQYQNAPSPRPLSQASSTRSSSVAADLLDKEAKLLQEIEEMEKKPYNPQTMVVEREQWFEYPEGRPFDRHLTDSKRRVKDFCSLPSHMYPEGGRHVHEENLPLPTISSRQSSASPGSVHTTIIRSPKREIDNRSPLPIAFDNFSTKGVRGNIASIGAIEPDRPRPPIYPIIKRTPSPSV